MSAMGGIGQQVVGDLFELGKGAVKGTVKAVADITNDSIEQLLSAPMGAFKTDAGNDGVKQQENKEQKVMVKRREEKRQFNEVKSQLAEYIERKKQQDAQIAREKAEQQQVSDQKKSIEKQKKDNFLAQLMDRLAKGSHGESERQKE